MSLEEFEKIFKENCKRNNIVIKKDKIEKLYIYMKLVLEWNEKINVTSIKDEKEFCVKHFIDSLLLNKYMDKCTRLIDIGTGAGFPGIPLKIYNSDIDVTLIDSVNKKIIVLNDIIMKLGLDKIEALHIRAEDLAQQKEYREKFDVVTTRAVSNLSTISEYMLPFVKIGGKAICMKGPNIEEEYNDGKKAVEILGGRISVVDKIMINSEIERKIIIINKIKNTEKRYPRGQGKPLKNPIK